MLKNTKNSYGLIAKLLHWVIGIIIVIMIIVGFTMTNMKGLAQSLQLYLCIKQQV